MSQTDVAGDRFSVSYISHLESGRRMPTPETARYLEEQLSLPLGTLGNLLVGERPATTGQGSSPDAVLTYNEAFEAWRAREFAHALQLAHTVRDELPKRGREDLAALLQQLLTSINMDLGRYREATEEARTLVDINVKTGSFLGEALAWCLVSRAARSDVDFKTAREAAERALSLIEPSREASSELRATALMASVAANTEGSRTRPTDTSQLEELQRLISDPGLHEHTKGLIAWVLGVVALRAGRIDEGLRWHADAGQWLSPAVDLRSWARFPVVSAYERLAVGRDEGLGTLLTEAATRVALLDGPDELASLAIVTAQFALHQGRTRDALATVDEALLEPGLPEATQGDLHLVRARAYSDSGDHPQARTAALTAARLFTSAGDLPKSRRAWALTDELDPARADEQS